MKASTIALVVGISRDKKTNLLEVLSDDREISLLEAHWSEHAGASLEKVHENRALQTKEDEEFGDYVEDLLSQPFVKPEIQQHGVQWLKSKLRIEQYQKSEAEAARIIADYALKVFQEHPEKRDFFLAGPRAQVRVRIFVLEEKCASRAA
jgi:hypothetical protein